MARKKIQKAEAAPNESQIDLRKAAMPVERKASEQEVMEEEEGDYGEFIEDDEKEEEIEKGLNEIYQDDNGELVDVHKLEKMRRRGFLLSLFNFLFLLLILGGGAYYLYQNWYKKASLDINSVTFTLGGDAEVVAGEEFTYELRYRNSGRAAISNVKVNISLPNNFILKETDPQFGATKGQWEIGEVGPQSEGVIKVKGQLLGKVSDNGIMSAYMSYSPKGYTTEYKKEAFATTKIIDIGLDISFDYSESVMVGDTEELLVKFRSLDMNYIDSFRMTLEPQDNVTILDYVPKESANKNNQVYATYTMDRSGVWEASGALDEERVIPVHFKVSDKADRQQQLSFKFEKKAEDGQYYEFFSKTIPLEAMKNNLNLAMIVNGKHENGGVNFGETLNYSIAYNNKGDADIKDVAIMAVLDGDYLDWTTLSDNNKGREKGNTITWTKEEIPALAEIKQDQEGVIDFSIKVFEYGKVENKGKPDISAYARFSVGKENSDDVKGDSSENKSNTIVTKINSDLGFDEKIRYFNEDNIPVGTGPNPPEVGQATTYKVYWTISNNLHELNKLAVTMKLPENVAYDNKDRETVGSMVYNDESRELVWNIGRLPTSAYQVSAEFSIKVTPSESNRNTIMVLLPGSTAQAVDVETGENLEKSSKPKTSKLDDDEIGASDGIVQ